MTDGRRGASATEEMMRYAIIAVCCLLLLAGGCGIKVAARGQMQGGVSVGQGVR